MLTDIEIDQICDWQSQAIEKKSLTEEQLNWLYENNWFNLWVPNEYHGLELPLLEGLARLEELAYWDGGLAWTVTLCSGANMFVGFMNTELASELWNNPKICLGGSGQIAGKAEWNGESYMLSGFWKYATGSSHLTHFTLNAPIYQHGIPQLDEEGNPLVRSFIIPRDQVLIHMDWNSMGLECTASHSFSLARIAIEPKQVFHLDPIAKTSQSAIYTIPFLSFAEMTLCVNYMGMYRRFLDLLEKYLFEKSKQNSANHALIKERFMLLDNKQVKFAADKAHLFNLFDMAWKNLLSGHNALEMEVFKSISMDCRSVVQELYIDLNELFPWTGIRGIQIDQEINIVYRNLLTARQHALLQN